MLNNRLYPLPVSSLRVRTSSNLSDIVRIVVFFLWPIPSYELPHHLLRLSSLELYLFFKVLRQPTLTNLKCIQYYCCYSRQSALVAHLYSGIQCNSCGVRFPPEQTLKYSQHLDWHFRQNRRDRDSTRTVMSRRYYYDVNDWVQFEEIEDLEERG